EPRIIWIKIDETTLDQKVADLENITPPSSVIDTCAPGAVSMNTRAGSLAGEDVGACHDPVKRRIVVQDTVNEPAKIGEQLADLFLSCSQTPLREKHQRILSEEFQDAGSARSDTFVVESLQV